MFRQDLQIMVANALTGLRAASLLLRWPLLALLHRDAQPAVCSVVARQYRTDALLLRSDEPARQPVRVLPWLLCQAVLGPSVLLLGAVVWALGLVAVSTPLWWRTASQHPPPDIFVTVNGTGNALIAGGCGVLVLLIAVACGHGLPRWHASVNRLLLDGRQRNRLTRRIAELTETRSGALEVQAMELRRIERDLHDGAQARLVSLSMLLGRLDLKLRGSPDDTRRLLGDARGEVGSALQELRDLVRGVYPPILADRGLAGGIESLAKYAGADLRDIDVTVDIPERLPVALESTVYFVVAESLTNVTKHSGASRAGVEVRSDGSRIGIKIRDDGRGGADERHGTGLTGLRRRVAAFDGDLSLASPVGGPTVLHVELPCVS
ncbi:histidine kinase [Streptomyces sp. DW26H14]|uniref:histidine kinase n=1 Tax=Streptomyces sp. DW26H14 TaxID=3435395 RepID=UPI00403E3119